MNNQEKHLGSDPEDVEDVLRVIEKSYTIRFQESELAHIRTFGELTDHVISKLSDISTKTGRQFEVTTLGELVHRMTLLNYTKSGRNPATVNVNEVRSKIEKPFVENLVLSESSIDRDTIIV